jgi:vesicle-fusing ATPase
MDSEFPFVKLICAEDMVGFSEMAKIQHMSKVFMDAHKSSTSVIVMDGIERIIEWVSIGPRFSNQLLQAMKALLNTRPPSGRRLLILATSTATPAVLKQLDIFNSFSSDIPVPNVNTYGELKRIMEDSQAFSFEETEEALIGIRDLTQRERIGLGVKKVLFDIGTVQQYKDRAGEFAAIMARAMDEEVL